MKEKGEMNMKKKKNKPQKTNPKHPNKPKNKITIITPNIVKLKEVS